MTINKIKKAALYVICGLSFLGSAQAAWSAQVSLQLRGDKAPLEVAMKATPKGQPGNLAYFWDFGDGQTSAEQNPTHVYYKPGKYIMSLNVTDDKGVGYYHTSTIEVLGGLEEVHLVFLPNPQGNAVVGTWGSQIYSPTPLIEWKSGGQTFNTEVLKINEGKSKDYTVGVTLWSDDRRLVKQLSFKTGVYGTNAAFEAEELRTLNQARMTGWQCGKLTSGGNPMPPLRRNAQLDQAAMAQAVSMAANGYFNHISPIDQSDVTLRVRGTGYRPEVVAENIAAGPPTATAVMNGWLRSLGHCDNIMDSDFSEVGLAYVSSPGAMRPTFWVQVFGSPENF